MKKIVVFLFIICICFFVYFNKDKLFKHKVEIQNVVNKKDIIEDILAYNNSDIDKDFLDYLKNNYGNKILKKLLNYIKNDEYDLSVWHKLTGNSYVVLKDLETNAYADMDNVKIVDDNENTISFVGDISLAENYKIMPAYDSRNKGVYGILSEDVVNIMKKSSVMVANNEFTISQRGTPIPNKMYTFRADPSRLSIYNEMGIDLVTLANNHIYDYGGEAFDDSLKYLKEYNIPYIGAGSNLLEAEKPYYFIINGYKVAFINATRAEKNILTPGASETTGGVFRCYDNTELKRVITETKTNSDFVVVLLHWGAEGEHELEEVQITSAKEYIDNGADFIIGSHAHTLQGMEFYNNKFIAYNLGDFIFNSYNEDTGILSITIDDDGTSTYKFVPCNQNEEYTDLLSGDQKKELLQQMENWSINATFSSDGIITLKQ